MSFSLKGMASILSTILVFHLQLASNLKGMEDPKCKPLDDPQRIQSVSPESNQAMKGLSVITSVDSLTEQIRQAHGEIVPADTEANSFAGLQSIIEEPRQGSGTETDRTTTSVKSYEEDAEKAVKKPVNYDKLLKRYAAGYITYPELLRTASLLTVVIGLNIDADYEDKIKVLVASNFGQAVADGLVTYYGARYWQTVREKDSRLKGWHGYWMIPSAALDGVLKFAGAVGLLFDQIYMPGIAWAAWIPMNFVRIYLGQRHVKMTKSQTKRKFSFQKTAKSLLHASRFVKNTQSSLRERPQKPDEDSEETIQAQENFDLLTTEGLGFLGLFGSVKRTHTKPSTSEEEIKLNCFNHFLVRSGLVKNWMHVQSVLTIILSTLTTVGFFGDFSDDTRIDILRTASFLSVFIFLAGMYLGYMKSNWT